MNPYIGNWWCEALTSGYYKQGQGRLRNPDTGAMCCLGVLCDISGLAQWEQGFVYAGDVYLPPKAVAEWLEVNPDIQETRSFGIDIVLPFHTPDGHQATLSACNDWGCTFPQIADLIRHFFLPKEAEPWNYEKVNCSSTSPEPCLVSQESSLQPV